MGGEQRGRANKLMIELQAGSHEIVLSQPDKGPVALRPGHCMDVSFLMVATPLHEDAGAAGAVANAAGRDVTGSGSPVAENLLGADERVLTLSSFTSVLVICEGFCGNGY